MKRILLLLLLFVASKDILSQRRIIDSLTLELLKAKHDTTKVVILRDMANAYINLLNADSALYRLNEGLSLSRSMGFVKGEAMCINALGVLAANKGERGRALELYVQAMKINEEIGELRGLSKNLNNIGTFYMKPGSHHVALQYILRAWQVLEQVEQSEPTPAQPNDVINLANVINCYRSLEKYDSARFYADKMYRLGKTKDNIYRVAGGLLHMGRISAAEQQYAVALEYYREGVRILEKLGLPLRSFHMNMAEVFEKTGRLDSALYYAKKAHESDVISGNLGNLDVSSTLLSRIYKKLNNKDSSMHYLELAVATRDTLTAKEQRTDVENILFAEKMRQLEIAQAKEKEKEERNNNLQYAAIGLALVTFVILFFVFSHSIMANQRLIRFLGVIALLIVFEFLNLLLHPWLGAVTHHSPVLMLLAMVCVAALLIPLHHKLEHWITNRLVEKNKKIRVAAAKKIIAQLEPETMKSR